MSLHAPATPETRGLIGEAELRAMKPTAYLINTSRGALVDEAALRRALDEGWIAGAALDVLAAEPPPADHPLVALANVIVTPHAGFYSEASDRRARDEGGAIGGARSARRAPAAHRESRRAATSCLSPRSIRGR